MRKRLFKIALFGLSLLLADGLVFGLFLQLTCYFKPEEFSIAQQLPPQDGLILGTSHAELGFVPSVLSKELGGHWFNGGRARRNLYFNAEWTKTLIAQGQKPKTVVLVVTYHDWNEISHPYMIYPLASDDQKWNVFTNLALRRQLLNPRTWFLCDQYSSTIRMMLARSLSWLKNRQGSLTWSNRGDSGYIHPYQIMKPQERPENFPRYAWHTQENNLLAFRSIIQQWQAIGARVIVTDPPEYLGSRLSHADYDKAWEYIEQQCRELNVQCRSFSQPSQSFLADEKNFSDGGWGYPNSHLSHRGAVSFSNTFSQWLQELGQK